MHAMLYNAVYDTCIKYQACWLYLLTWSINKLFLSGKHNKIKPQNRICVETNYITHSSRQPSERTQAMGTNMKDIVTCDCPQVSIHSRLQSRAWWGAPESPQLQLQQSYSAWNHKYKTCGLTFWSSVSEQFLQLALISWRRRKGERAGVSLVLEAMLWLLRRPLY